MHIIRNSTLILNGIHDIKLPRNKVGKHTHVHDNPNVIIKNATHLPPNYCDCVKSNTIPIAVSTQAMLSQPVASLPCRKGF